MERQHDPAKFRNAS